MNKTLSTIESYIGSRRFRLKLRKDLETLRIIQEADFQACFYFHLRKFIGRDNQWRIFSEKRTPFGNIIDLVISQKSRHSGGGYKPRIAIELKRSRDHISSKDRKSLGKSLRRLKVNKTYFFTANYHGENYDKTAKKKSEKYRLYDWDIRLGKHIRDNPTKLNHWREQRRRIKENQDISSRK